MQTNGNNPSAQPAVALVHDYLLTPRGAERTFAAIAECWPGAPIFTTLYDAEAMAGRLPGHSVTTSLLQAIRPGQRNFRALLPLLPKAAESLPVGDRDLVISSSSAFAHGVRPAAAAAHVCYCHTPFRYVWHERERTIGEAPWPVRGPLSLILDRVRKWDVRASGRVTHYVANSRLTQRRIADSYGRDSVVIHPPVDVARFGEPQVPGESFLFVGEITTHKRVETAVAAACLANVPMKVVGDGPDRERLQALYGDRVEFTGRVDDAELCALLAQALALVVPNVEEFGIAAVEAMAAGRPVIAPAAGGTLETVVDGVTGVHVGEMTTQTLAEAMADVDYELFDPVAIARHAQRFSAERFQREFSAFVAGAVA